MQVTAIQISFPTNGEFIENMIQLRRCVYTAH